MLSPELILDMGEPDEEDTAPTAAPPDDVLVVSLGIINDCPGMLTEQKVRIGEFASIISVFSVPRITFAAEYKIVMHTSCCKL